MSNYEIFKLLQKKYTTSQISSYLGLHEGTVKRWIVLKEVPPQYYFDLCRMAEIKIDYDVFSAKEKDQFFTSKATAKYCYEKTKEVLSDFNVELDDYTIIEPSAGSGTTAIASFILGRNCITMDINQQAIQLTNEAINECKSTNNNLVSLFG
jgi:ABC-type proline/glycine betaine transport system substrate-binding protein